MSVEGERGRMGTGRQGNIISPEPASDYSRVQNVLGFIQDYVPQAVAGAKGERKERVVWAKFETGDINDAGMEHHWGWGGGEGGECGGRRETSSLPLLLVLGLTSGLSVWVIPPCGDAKEVYCCYGDGERTRTVCFLPSPDSAKGEEEDEEEDKFFNQRPLLAVVKKGRLSSGSVPYSSVQLLSLRAGGGESLVKRIQFKGQPVVGLLGNRQVMVVVLRKRIVVLDSKAFNMRFYIKNSYPQLEYPLNPVALGQRWLAFPENKLSLKYRSIGGVSSTQAPSVATSVIKNVRKGLTAITDTFSGLTGKPQQATDNVQHHQSSDHSTSNVVTVLDVAYDHPEEVKLHEAGREERGVVAHFLAHLEHGEHVATINFNCSGTLLLTASTEGHTFHIFHLMPHPCLSSQTSVHHIYQLYRGATLARVQDVHFSLDSRWTAISTLNGTTHLFPIMPFGGEITVRTHTSNWVANKLSRFHTSAGLESIPSLQSHSHATTSPTSISSSSSPASQPSSSISSSSSQPEKEGTPAPSRVPSWGNPRSVPLPSPLRVTALYQIKQPYLTSSSDANSPAVGVVSSVASSSGHHGNDPDDLWSSRPDVQCVRAFFSLTPHTQASPSTEAQSQSASYSLYVVGGSGVLTQHHLLPRRHDEAREGDDAPISLECGPLICWKLLSKPHLSTIRLPLCEDNPLIMANNDYKEFLKQKKKRKGERGGGGGGDSSARRRSEGEWLSQVEILTHATPTRRLWMGPQFSFKTYTPSRATGSVSPTTSDLISLSPEHTLPSNIQNMSLTGGEEGRKEEEEEGSAVLSLSHETLLSDLLSQPTSLRLQQLHTSPISMATGPDSGSREHGMESGPHSMERGVLEVCGSWQKVAPQLEASQLTEMERKLAEAISDQTSHAPSHTTQVTMATQRSTHTKTGFQAPSEQV